MLNVLITDEPRNAPAGSAIQESFKADFSGTLQEKHAARGLCELVLGKLRALQAIDCQADVHIASAYPPRLEGSILANGDESFFIAKGVAEEIRIIAEGVASAGQGEFDIKFKLKYLVPEKA